VRKQYLNECASNLTHPPAGWELYWAAYAASGPRAPWHPNGRRSTAWWTGAFSESDDCPAEWGSGGLIRYPAWEVLEAKATQHYKGLFTDCLLKTLHAPGGSLVEQLLNGNPPLSVITSRRLKPCLQEQVPLTVAAVIIQLTQQPVLRIKTASPNYFVVVPPAPLGQEPPRHQHDFTYNYRGNRGKASRGLIIFLSTAQAGFLHPTNQVPNPAAVAFAREVAQLRGHPGQLPIETATGFTLIGAFVEMVVAPGWEVDYPAGGPLALTGQFIRLTPQAGVGVGAISVRNHAVAISERYRDAAGHSARLHRGSAGGRKPGTERELPTGKLPGPGCRRGRAGKAKSPGGGARPV
jgi:hypothetical protein